MKRLIALTITMLMVFVFPAVAGGNDDDKVTICHAAGQAGTTKFVTITVDRNALKGHFDEKGTPLAGHEQDYMGACKDPSPSPSAKPSESAKPSQSAKPTASPVAAPTEKPATTAAPKTSAPAAPIKKLPSTSTN